ncbi:hypothetical protein DSO57_1019723 [Entomophthora muscae]|uniref:Uncharacterized protein n=1 Tax=Entomophthora muscae TaxID=34485 RepID=A0ACC2SGP2_9FUNG|nr:hypothetical protein DSO57_1019723 [Entomophthora muscae]
MEDQELQQIRAQRMAQLQANVRGGGGDSRGPTALSGPPGEDDGKAQKMEELRDRLLLQILDNEARQRLQRISLVKPDKARAVEDRLISLAQSGRLRGVVTEQALIQFLSQISQAQSGSGSFDAPDSNTSGPKIVYSRRRFDDSDDEDDYGL